MGLGLGAGSCGNRISSLKSIWEQNSAGLDSVKHQSIRRTPGVKPGSRFPGSQSEAWLPGWGLYLFACGLAGVLVIFQLPAFFLEKLQSLHDPLRLHTNTQPQRNGTPTLAQT